ncbi:uncharacterized protein H6S33_003715 [Morchella sextelata]|uniref:uncharacterized protein n=1 Tax=Morchella sextelata TaxID=1174677 RepID=UPI001D048A9C|nr:uncharacterized protein H6S33_003715 [Morchella sextelata]KAH0606881.1 hypothetical protein H6S33_003715 [Morchella sextelata]
MLAAAYGRDSIIKLLLDNGATTCSRCSDPMFMAIQVGSLATVRALIDNGADCNSQGATWVRARRYNDTQDSGIFFQMKNQNLLQHAILSMIYDGGSEQVVSLLLANGAKVKGPFPLPVLMNHSRRVPPEPLSLGELGETPLHIAEVGGYTGIVRRLIALGADVNAVAWPSMHYGRTPLEVAAFKGKMAAVQLLLDNGAEITSMGPKYNGSAVHAAAAGEHVSLLQQLISLCSAIGVSSILGEDHPLYSAARCGRKDCVKEIVKQDCFGAIFWDKYGHFCMAQRHMKYFDWESWMGHTWEADPTEEGGGRKEVARWVRAGGS